MATATAKAASSSVKKPAAKNPRRKTPRKYKKRKTKTKTKTTRKIKRTTKKRKTTKRKTTGKKTKGRKGKVSLLFSLNDFSPDNRNLDKYVLTLSQTNQILDFSKLKEMADGNFRFDKVGRSSLKG